MRRRIEAGEAVVAGVLSGTSGDGIDVACVRFGREDDRLVLLEVLAGETQPFPGDLAREVRAVLDGAPCDLRRAALLDRDLGRAFGEAARGLARRAGLALDLVGSHGQTVYHHDDVEPTGPATRQLGDGCHVAEAAGCPVVSDFRQADVAAGGGGAPLSAYGDEVLFARRPLVLLNLGGMANLTWLPEAGPPLAFDVGPANALLDGLARLELDRPMDRDGRAALRGRADPAGVEALRAHPFVTAPPPKSTGRDTFGPAWVEALGWRGSAEDRLATAVDAVGACVADALERWVPGAPGELCVAGGGVHNRALCLALERRTGRTLVTTASLGLDPDLREAAVFAALAARHVLGEGCTAPSATGARPGRVLGKWSPGKP